ncbi:MAG: D-alanine--D-alanine ligase family protein [Gemmatimonadales bacterium]
MKIAVVFDTVHPEWEDADYRQEIAGGTVDEAEYDAARALEVNGHEVSLVGVRDDVRRLVERLAAHAPALVFNCCEGFAGDARHEYAVAALLEMHGYRHTGSSPTGLLVARNKSLSKKILAFHGIRVPDFAVFRPGDVFVRPSALRYPVIVKPLLEDASLGIAQASVVTDDESFAERVSFIHDKFHQAAIAEELIDGRELYVSLLGNAALEVLPIVELHFGKLSKAERRIATYKAKWDEEYRERQGIRTGFARRLSDEVLGRIRRVCETAFHALWLQDYGRIDLRLTHDHEVYVLEANPNPFLAAEHELALAAAKAGMRYPALIQRIVDEAMAR